MTTTSAVHTSTVVVATAAAATFSAILTAYIMQHRHRKRDYVAPITQGVLGAIGNTPLIRINSLSEATGCEVSCSMHHSQLLCTQCSSKLV